jgi:hypothetical protein
MNGKNPQKFGTINLMATVKYEISLKKTPLKRTALSIFPAQ